MPSGGRAAQPISTSARLKLDDATNGYAMFKRKDDRCIKVVLKP
jgi:threonine dehydrogenase-like Zn-dependent dehydrogenase